MHQINDSITETQEVSFVLDSSSRFSDLNKIDLSSYSRGIILCDESVSLNWLPKLKHIISNQLDIEHVELIKAVESSKNLNSFLNLIEILESKKCSTRDLIIAIGGGVVLDVSSFLASTYMRGVPLMMIPSTLIGQADASTAGKTCLNSMRSKNLMGSYYLPKIVYNNIEILSTTSPHSMRQGISEIFKYGLLGSKKLINLLEKYSTNKDKSFLIDIIEETIKVRLTIRKQHPLASNLGHTFGHAIEKCTNYAVSHGDAISVGTVMALEFGNRIGITTNQVKSNIIEKMQLLGLNVYIDSSLNVFELTDIMMRDKKSFQNQIGLVLLKEIEKPYFDKGNPFYYVKPDEINEFFNIFINKSNFTKENHWNYLMGNVN